MLSKSRSKKVFQLKYLVLLPLVLGMLVYSSCEGEKRHDSLEVPLKVSVEENNVPFAVVDEVPVFPGCENEADKKACFQEKIQDHIRKHFNYPQEALDLGIEGKVSVVFQVTEDGSITNIRKRGPHELLENEVERIINRLPKMQPGEHDGKAVSVPFSIPIIFSLTGTSAEAINDNNQKVNTTLNNENKMVIPFAYADVSPIFPGCENTTDQRACFQKRIGQYVIQSKELNKTGITGRAYAIFVIGSDGRIKNVKVKGSNSQLNNKVLQVIENIPVMKPGMKDGKPVNLSYSIPINLASNDVSDIDIQVSGYLMEEGSNSVFVGKVFSSKASKLAGVNIILKGGNMGVVSDGNGTFSIAAKKGQILKLEYEGATAKLYKIE